MTFTLSPLAVEAPVSETPVSDLPLAPEAALWHTICRSEEGKATLWVLSLARSGEARQSVPDRRRVAGGRAEQTGAVEARVPPREPMRS